MSRRYDMGEQDTSATRAVSNRRKVTVKVCMLDDSVVIFMLSIFVGISSVLKVLKFSDVLRSPR